MVHYRKYNKKINLFECFVVVENELDEVVELRAILPPIIGWAVA